MTPQRAAEIAKPGIRYLNRWLMKPALARGLGPWIGTPIGGWLLLLRTRGRRSGLIRAVPLSYLIDDGAIWIAAGFGPRTDWLVNLRADPFVEVVLTQGTMRCAARVEDDLQVRARIIPRFVRATGLPALLGGIDPYFSSAAARISAMRDVPLVRLDPLSGPIRPGPDDPGGRGWLWRQALIAMIVLAALRSVARLARRAASRRCSTGPGSRSAK